MHKRLGKQQKSGTARMRLVFERALRPPGSPDLVDQGSSDPPCALTQTLAAIP